MKPKTRMQDVFMGSNTKIQDFILGSNYQTISECVYEASDITEALALAATSICRRRFKKQDMIIMVVLDDCAEGESGIVFTQDKLFYWEMDEEFRGEIAYEDISDVDYDKTSVTVFSKDGTEIVIACEDDGDMHYGRYMYHFLMDIRDFVAEDSVF